MKGIVYTQEIIKVRECIPHIGLLARVIRLKLFLYIVPSSFVDITRALRGCFRGGSVYVSFRFVLKQSKTSNSVKMSSLIF